MSSASSATGGSRSGLIPVVNPVHHAEKREGGNARIDLAAAAGASSPQHRRQDVRVMPLLRVHACRNSPERPARGRAPSSPSCCSRSSAGGFRSRGETPQRVRFLFQQVDPGSAERAETVVLDQEEQLFLAAEVVVQPRQAHFRRAADVPDARFVIPLFRENRRRGFQDPGELVVVGPARVRGRLRSSLFRTNVRPRANLDCTRQTGKIAEAGPTADRHI